METFAHFLEKATKKEFETLFESEVKIDKNTEKELQLFFINKRNGNIVKVPNFANNQIFNKFLFCFESFEDLQKFIEKVNDKFQLKNQIIKTSCEIGCEKYNVHKIIIFLIIGLLLPAGLVLAEVFRRKEKTKLDELDKMKDEEQRKIDEILNNDKKIIDNELKKVDDCEKLFYNSSSDYVTDKDGFYIPKIIRVQERDYLEAKTLAKFPVDEDYTRVKTKQKCNQNGTNCCYLDYTANGKMSKELFEKFPYNYLLEHDISVSSNFIEDQNKKYPELVGKPFYYCFYYQDYDAIGTDIYDPNFPNLVEVQFGEGKFEKAFPIIYGVYDNEKGTQTHIYRDGTTSTDYYGHVELGVTNSTVEDPQHPELAKAWTIIKILYDIHDLVNKTCSIFDRNKIAQLQNELKNKTEHLEDELGDKIEVLEDKATKLQGSYKRYRALVVVFSVLFSLNFIIALCYSCYTEEKNCKMSCLSCRKKEITINIDCNDIKDVINLLATENNVDKTIIKKFNENMAKIEKIRNMKDKEQQKNAFAMLKTELGNNIAYAPTLDIKNIKTLSINLEGIKEDEAIHDNEEKQNTNKITAYKRNNFLVSKKEINEEESNKNEKQKEGSNYNEIKFEAGNDYKNKNIHNITKEGNSSERGLDTENEISKSNIKLIPKKGLCGIF